MLRNFRRDGHNRKKKKDGKTVKEAHEHLKVSVSVCSRIFNEANDHSNPLVVKFGIVLKVGNEERIHVYYAHGEDSSTFVRRCYWLLDKTLEHVVLVHYRETIELSTMFTVQSQGFSNNKAAPVSSGSALSGPADMSASWDLSGQPDSAVDRQYSVSQHAHLEPNSDMTVQNHEQRLLEINTLEWDDLLAPGDSNKIISTQQGICMMLLLLGVSSSLERMSTVNNGNEISFHTADGQMTSSFQENESGVMTIFVIRHFHGGQSHLDSSSLCCVCGDACFPAEILQPVVYRCVVSPQTPGLVNIYLSFNGNKPISQIMSFEFRAPSVHLSTEPPENKSNWDELALQMRLAHLLFSTSKSLNILSSKIHQELLKDAKTFAGKCSHIIDNWACLIKSIEDKKLSVACAKDRLFVCEPVYRNGLWKELLKDVKSQNMTSEVKELFICVLS
ncbi:Calmodulin-binding transcription activator 6 [Capsicum chinense]|nr:Calmodulin-binding transcription activator 6 [Capsicum chinense]